jgi:Uma2 family endonuclease
MATATQPPDVTPAEPEGLYEVVGDQIIEKPPMGAFEGGIACLLLEWMGPFARSNGLGQVVLEILFDLRPAVDRERRPDLAFVSAGKWPIERRPPRQNAWAMVPDLAIEVVSPTNPASEVLAKVQEYLRAGCRAVWVIYPVEAEVHRFDAENPSIVRRLGPADALEGGALLPGFRLALADLFADPGEEG